ncbi:MAG: hypothetical protein KatS3mg068_1722 [Candidatus Sericytochromatia bacterium]|nr:MAG: hypothetical protein KatS3mg068_1722 [Candidatus Sericytochromatia bacterium]
MLITNPLNEEQRKKIQEEWNSHYILQYMGVKVNFSNPEYIEVYIDPIQQFHRGGMGTDAVNGAIISALFDLAIGLVGVVNADFHRTGTVQLNMNFLKPLRGNKLSIISKLVKKGKSLVFAYAEAIDENNQVCATCNGISSIDYSKNKVEHFISI